MSTETYPCYVRIGDEKDNEELVEVPTENDGMLLLSTIQAQFPDAIGLRVKSESGGWMGVRLSEGVLDPPLEGWGDEVYYIQVTKAEQKRKNNVEDYASSMPKKHCSGKLESTTCEGLLDQFPQKKQMAVDDKREVKHIDGGGEDASSMGKQILCNKKEPITYKSLLNKFAERKHLPLPRYNSVTANGNIISTTMTFNGNQYTVKSGNSKHQKQSEQRAAQMALNAVIGTPLTPDTPIRRKISYKHLLDKMTENEHLSPPIYQIDTINSRFFSTVTVNGNKFKDETTYNTIEKAEASVAQVALDALIGVPLTSNE